MSKMKIAVVIPVYNCEDYLRKCLDSVIMQTIKEIEIICVNDESTDASLDILKEYANRDNRICILSQENKGPGEARNYGLRECNSEFIRFLDADDWYPDEQVLERMYMAAIRNKVNVVAGSIWDYNGGSYITEFEGDYKDYVFQKEERVSFENFQYDFAHHRYLFKVSFLRSNEIVYPNYCIYEDPVFLVRALTSAGELYTIPECVYVHRLGYKEYKPWTSKQAIDLVMGMTEIVKIAKENNFCKLMYLQVSRIDGRYRKELVANLMKKNNFLAKRLLELNELIDVRMIQDFKHDYSERQIIAPLSHYILQSTDGGKTEKRLLKISNEKRNIIKRILPIKVITFLQRLKV